MISNSMCIYSVSVAPADFECGQNSHCSLCSLCGTHCVTALSGGIRCFSRIEEVLLISNCLAMGDSSSDDELPEEWQMYCERPEWSDVVPIEQDDGENPVVVIAYSDKFKDVYNYFRAIVASGEKSERALELTKDALVLNPANYTVWQYRRDVLKALNADLSNELDYVADVIESNGKNYQVWHHRRVIVEWLQDPGKELELTEKILRVDSKNYHAWQHRQWVISTYRLFDNELNFVDRLLGDDVRNNSAWNQRFFVLKHTGFDTNVISREIMYAMNRIRLVTGNESSWNFLRGILQQSEDPSLDHYPEVVAFCEELFDSGSRSPHLLAFLIDMYIEKALRTKEGTRDEYAHRVTSLCDLMIEECDTIRSRYWRYILDNFYSNYKASGSVGNHDKETTPESENISVDS
ncbi:protein farnesyltransferase/geranylgeranyltransferase type-1 subunit alpha [Phlebotomus argentipes]|uniref:protein farnesyltransferase/geranylgeranyltransferase type-1 subunit alpha n=1 Tax=Phlebotomus argentipes TaxID=94469 RepID=UPI002892B333|nr:protein farnesyltransferase/geranylgeranyltransferase type-1 subunit alpha [Phlebotomus argentipes]